MAENLTVSGSATIDLFLFGPFDVPFEGTPVINGSSLSISNNDENDPAIFNLGGEYIYSVDVEVDFFDMPSGGIMRVELVSIDNNNEAIAGSSVSEVSGTGTVTLTGIEVNSFEHPRLKVTARTSYDHPSKVGSRTIHIEALRKESSGAIVGWKTRTSNSSMFEDTRVKVLSARAGVVEGRSYMIVANGEVERLAPGCGTTQHELRITTDDTEPTTTSTQIGRTVLTQNSSGLPTGVQILGTFDATSNGYLRAAVVSHRPVGCGEFRWTADSDRPMSLTIIDAGPTIPADGVAS